MADTGGHDSPARDFARIIRDRRAQLGLTQDEVAALAGISHPAIRRLEAGALTPVDPERVRAICQALDIDLADAAVALGYADPTPAANTDEYADLPAGSFTELERLLIHIRDDRRRSPELRAQAQRQLDQLAEIREHTRAEILASGEQPARLAAALRLTHTPVLTADQQRNLDAAIACAEADADAIYGAPSSSKQNVA